MNTDDRDLLRILASIGLHPGICAACDKGEISDKHVCWDVIDDHIDKCLEESD
jgi:hypothetical protein